MHQASKVLLCYVLVEGEKTTTTTTTNTNTNTNTNYELSIHGLSDANLIYNRTLKYQTMSVLIYSRKFHYYIKTAVLLSTVITDKMRT
jgi:hypothetical protein